MFLLFKPQFRILCVHSCSTTRALGILHSKEQFSNILDKWNIKICNLNLTFKHTEDQVLRSSFPPNRNRSAEIQRLLFPQKQMISCINRKRSPFKIKPFSDIYVKFHGNSRELNFSKCHGHFQNKDSFTQR